MDGPAQRHALGPDALAALLFAPTAVFARALLLELERRRRNSNAPGCESRASLEILRNQSVVDSLRISLTRPLPWAQYGFAVVPMQPTPSEEPAPAK